MRGQETYLVLRGQRYEVEEVLQEEGSEVSLRILREDRDPNLPLVSVLLPNYNDANRVGAMLESLKKQSFKDFEVIVADDGSSDGSVETLRPWLQEGVVTKVVLHGRNQGAGAAINTASRHARGLYWTWVSADNVMTEDWLSQMVGLMTPGTGVVYANYDRFDENGPVPGQWGKPYDPNNLVNDQNCFFGPAFLIRASVWKEVGEHRGKSAHDYDHWLRVEESCWGRGLKIEYTSQILCHYYSGPMRATVTRRTEYDAHVWQEEARKRRAAGAAK